MVLGAPFKEERMTLNHKGLIVWNKSMDLVTEVYKLTQQFPREELFGLMSQMRRSAVSIPSNIAEGKGRLSKKEFHYYLGTARGSLAELETQIVISLNLKYLTSEESDNLLDRVAEVGRLLNGLLTSVRNQ
jgi:four helix bundle protein